MDMFETKEYFNIICQKANIEKIVNFAVAAFNESTKNSKTSALSVLNPIISALIDRQNKKEKAKAESPGIGDDDDMIV